jgi:hypothetical protein
VVVGLDSAVGALIFVGAAVGGWAVLVATGAEVGACVGGLVGTSVGNETVGAVVAAGVFGAAQLIANAAIPIKTTASNFIFSPI